MGLTGFLGAPCLLVLIRNSHRYSHGNEAGGSVNMFVCSVLQVAENFVPPLLEAVLIDYQRNVPAAREPEVLSTMATIVNKLGVHITGEIPKIFDAVFECTLNMINKVCLSR